MATVSECFSYALADCRVAKMFTFSRQTNGHCAAYATHDQHRFTISEVAADWHELTIPERTMRPSIASANQQTTGPAVQPADIPSPQQPH